MMADCAQTAPCLPLSAPGRDCAQCVRGRPDAGKFLRPATLMRRAIAGSGLMAHADGDVLACRACPARHRTKLDGTDRIERLGGEIRCRADATGVRTVFGQVAVNPHVLNRAGIRRPLGVILMEQTAEWSAQRGCGMTLAPNVRAAKRWP